MSALVWGKRERIISRSQGNCENCGLVIEIKLGNLSRGGDRFCGRKCYQSYRVSHPEIYKLPKPCKITECKRMATFNQNLCKECASAKKFVNLKPKVTTVRKRRKKCEGCGRVFYWRPGYPMQTRKYCNVPCARKAEAKMRLKADPAQVISLFSQGISPSMINEILGFNYASTPAFSILRNAGLIAPKKSKPHLMPAEISHIRKLYEMHGMSTAKIAPMVNLAQCTVHKILVKQGVKMRPAGWASRNIKINRRTGEWRVS